MSLNILEKKETPLLSRTIVTASLTYSGVTPSTTEVQNQLASSLKADQKLVVVKKIKTGFGLHSAQIKAYIYDSEEHLKKVEPKLHKKQIEKLKKAEEASKEKADSAREAEETKAKASKEDAPPDEKSE